jgi:hypothetical protein
MSTETSNSATTAIIELKAFIDNTWDDVDQERWDNYEDNHEETHRPTKQGRLVDKLSAEDVQGLTWLRQAISSGKLQMMDKESMTIFTSSGFFLDSKKNIIVFHER